MEEVHEKENQWFPTSPSAASTTWDSLPDVATPVPDEVREEKRDEENSSPLPAGAATMLRAKTLAQMAMDDLRETETRRSSNASHVQRLREECQVARSRIQQNVSSVSKVFEIIRSLESYLVNLEDCKSRVKQARNARWADLSVCQKRLELLSKLDWFEKPSSEQKSGKTGVSKVPSSQSSGVSRGNLMEALEFEREALLLLRRELASLLCEFDPIIELTVDLRKRLQQEASERRAVMRKDHATLTQQEGSEQENVSGARSFDDGHFWAKKAKSLEDSAQQLLQRAISTLQCTDLECCQANQSVLQSLARCSAEEQRMRRQYDAQLRDVNFAMSCAEWTKNKPEHRRKTAQEGCPQAQRAGVLLHELSATKKQLKILVRKCKRDLQILENCRNTTPQTIVSVNLCKKRVPEKQKGETKDEAKPGKPSSKLFGVPDVVAVELAGFELRHLRAEERQLREKLQIYETRIERCAAWETLLTDLEDRVAEALA